MKAEGHRETGEQLEESIKELLKDPEKHVKAIVEIVFGAAHHHCAAGLEEKYGEHPEKYQQLSRIFEKE